MNPDAALTVEAVRVKGWQCVRLAPRAKTPVGAHWQITTSADEVASWFEAGANVGLICHEHTGVAVLDPDQMLDWADMVAMLGQPCLPWVITGSGRLHYYFRWMPDLPAKLIWAHKIIGEIQRGPGKQQVVLPGSVHPDGGTYTWITRRLAFLSEPIDPVTDPLPELAGLWLANLHSSEPIEYARRSFARCDDAERSGATAYVPSGRRAKPERLRRCLCGTDPRACRRLDGH